MEKVKKKSVKRTSRASFELNKKICDLNLSITGTAVEKAVSLLYFELESKGIPLRPLVYLGDEWFSPEGMVAIAVPFYLVNKKLLRLHKKYGIEVEGEKFDDLMKLLRHEAGHCFDHAYKISKTRNFLRFFGNSKRPYDPDHYKPVPRNPDFVVNLKNWYAQAHPDEDFAETFAVWLNPKSQWKDRYQLKRKALQKLLFLDRFASKLPQKNKKTDLRRLVAHQRKLRKTLLTYFNDANPQPVDTI